MVEMGVSESSGQKLRDITNRLLETDPREIMAYWINEELEGAEMYHRLYRISRESTWDERIPSVFLVLYNESIRHAEKLFEMYKRMFPGEKPGSVQVPSLKVELSEDRLERMLRHGRIRDLLEILMEGEKSAAEVYEYLEKHVENSDTEKIFNQLSQMERGHYQRLKELYEALD